MRDWCTCRSRDAFAGASSPPPTSSWHKYCYWDPGHCGVSRMVYGDLDRAPSVQIESCYGKQELMDDGGSSSAEGQPWRVELLAIAPPAGETVDNRWFFGNFSLKEAEGRHKDFYVRYVSQSVNKVLQFYEALPDSITPRLRRKCVNEWSRVLPSTNVTWSCAGNL